MTPTIAMIAAVGRNGVIGAGNAIPWRLPSDFAFFKRVTMGKPLIMGRKTFESIGRPLPGRTNIVVTASPGFAAEGIEIVADLDAALARASEIAVRDGVDEIMIGGGGAIYAALMARADRLYITHVAAEPKGTVVFPEIDPQTWQVVGEPEVLSDPRDSASFGVRVYERRGPGAH